MKRLLSFSVLSLLLLAGCGGGGGSGDGSASVNSTPEATAAVAASAATIGAPAASSFLAQASFGGTLAQINALAAQRNYNDWFTQQAAATPCLELPRLQSAAQSGLPLTQALRVEAWWYCAVQGSDQLRQRMAWALSQILVVSDQGVLGGYPEAMASYYDVLSSNALGNYRALLGAMARAPAMGVYLNMFGSRKADPVLGIRADENFSRELMQLFTIGLVKLNNDGSVQLDSQQQPIPTYTQADVEQQANALTGWGFPGGQFTSGTPQWTVPMQPTAAFHDSSAKTLVGNVPIPAGLDANTELDRVLDNLFAHPNVGPFIARQLIQRLVSSNPSPAYVARVAAVFNNNGSGVRGDLLAVAKAILLDSEARTATGYGKVREPLLRLAQLWRVFQASAGNGRYDLPNPEQAFAQAPLRSPSVFNFYRPDYQPPGSLSAAGVGAPELQILDESTINNGGQAFYYLDIRYRSTSASTVTDSTTVALDFRPWESLAANPATLVASLDLALTGSRTSSAATQLLSSYIATIPAKQPQTRIFEALDMLIHAPQSYIQR